MIDITSHELPFIFVMISILFGNSLPIFWEKQVYIHTADGFPYKLGQIRKGRQVCICYNYKQAGMYYEQN